MSIVGAVLHLQSKKRGGGGDAEEVHVHIESGEAPQLNLKRDQSQEAMRSSGWLPPKMKKASSLKSIGSGAQYAKEGASAKQGADTKATQATTL